METEKLKRWRFWRKFVYTFARLSVPILVDKFFNIEVNGVDHVKKFPEGTPVIFCGNHKSHLDALLFAAAIAHPKRKLRRYVGFMVNGKSMNENFLFRQTKLLGGFPVYRENPEPALNYAINTLQSNLSVIVFPQGGRISRSSVLSDYHNLAQEGKTGVGRIILRLNGKVPVIPFYIHGSENVLRVGSLGPKWGAYMSITFGEPIYFNQYSKELGWNTQENDYFDSSRIIVNDIMHHIWLLLKDVEANFLELLEQKMGLPLSSIDESIHESKINKFIRKFRHHTPIEIYKFLNKNE